MPNTIAAKCPCCGVEAIGLDELDKIFGKRQMDGKTWVQSYCRRCRARQCTPGEPKHGDT